MRRLLLLTLALALGAASAHADDAVDAAAIEARAFVAVKERRWCEAKVLFEDAHDLGPAAALLVNAGMAANFAGDRTAAVALLTRAAPLTEDNEKRADIEKKRAGIEAKIQSEGPGTPCPARAVAVVAPPVVPPPPTVVPVPPQARPITPPIAKTPTKAPAPTASSSALPLGLAIGGGALAVTGGVLVGVGLVPWFDHAAAVSALQTAQARQRDAPGAAAAQQDARARWEDSGLTLVRLGSSALVVGVVALGVGGAIWWGDDE